MHGGFVKVEVLVVVVGERGEQVVCQVNWV